MFERRERDGWIRRLGFDLRFGRRVVTLLDMEPTRRLRRALVGATGVATIAVGIVLMPLPGPGTLIVLGGLTVLRKDFPFAGRVLDRVKDMASGARAGRSGLGAGESENGVPEIRASGE